MNEQHEKIRGLISGSIKEELSSTGQAELAEWLAAAPENAAFFDRFQNYDTLRSTLIEFDQLQETHDHYKLLLLAKLGEQDDTRTMPLKRISGAAWRYAAAVLLILAVTAYWWTTYKRPADTAYIIHPVPIKNEIQPGRQGALLTLADGTVLALDSLGHGTVAAQAGANIVWKDGRLAYDPTKKTATEHGYNTLSTPKGRQFQLILPDGSKVWLNAASSLHYPTTFAGSERKVEVTGEAYFEVAPNSQMPFRVSVGNETTVDVLGTHFNINAYPDEPYTSTTLLEGRVKVLKRNTSQVLEPGQQAIIKEGIILKSSVNQQQVIAWKNGVFNLEGATLEEFMRQVARWYDLDIVYEGRMPDKRFKGEMGRNLVLSEVLETLSYFKINYRLEGKTLIIE